MKIKYLKVYVAQTILLLLCCITVFPFLWVIITSLKTVTEITRLPPNLIFFEPTVENYVLVFGRGIVGYAVNSFVIAGGTVLVGILIGVPAAYSLSRAKFRGAFFLMFVLIGLRFIPYVAIVLPLYVIMVRLGIVGTRISIIWGFQIIVLPLMIWITKSFFDQIPYELEEASMIDGCSKFQSFRKIALPLISPAVGTVVVLGFIQSWNEFFIAMMFSGRDTRPLTVGLQQFLGGEFIGQQWGPMAAWAVLTTVPIVGFAFVVSKILVQGFGGVAD